jgi:hypothetical protein
MGTVSGQELRTRIAHYRSLQRMMADKQTLDALAHLIDEAEDQLRHLGTAQEKKIQRPDVDLGQCGREGSR